MAGRAGKRGDDGACLGSAWRLSYSSLMQALLTSEAFAFIPESVNVTPAFDIGDMMAWIGAGKDGFGGKISYDWLAEVRGPVEFMPEA